MPFEPIAPGRRALSRPVTTPRLAPEEEDPGMEHAAAPSTPSALIRPHASLPIPHSPNGIRHSAITNPYYQRDHAADIRQQERALGLQQQAEEQQAREQQRAEEERLRTEAAQAEQQRRRANFEAKHTLRQQGRPFDVDETGAPVPFHSDTEWQTLQQQKAEDAKRRTQWKLEGRPFIEDQATGLAIPEHDDATWQKTRAEAQAKEAEATRRRLLKEEIDALDAQQGDPARRPLTQERRDALAKKLTQTAEQSLRSAEDRLMAAAGERSGTGDWIPFNEKETPAALEARQKLDALTARRNAALEQGQPYAPTPEDDDLLDEPAREQLRGLRAQLEADDANRKFHEEQETAKFELNLRLNNPQEWERREKARLNTLDAPTLADLAGKQSESYTAKATALNAEAAAMQAEDEALEAQWQALEQENAALRAKGIAAADLVTTADGQPWHRDTWTRLQQLQEQALTQAQAQQPRRQALQTRASLLEQERSLAQHAAELAAAKQREATAAQRTKLRNTPGLAPFADALDALETEKAQRMAAIEEQFGATPPDGSLSADLSPARQQAVEALEADLAQKQQAIVQGMAEKERAGAALYAFFRDPLRGPASGKVHEYDAQRFGLTPEETTHWINHYTQRDWSRGDTKAESRVTTDGALLINPSLLSDEKAYRRAVEQAKADPAAKTAALERYASAREELGKQTLAALSAFSDDSFLDNAVSDPITGPIFASLRGLRDELAKQGVKTAEAELSFNDWTQQQAQKDPAFARLPRGEQALRYVATAKADRLWLSKLADQVNQQIWTGLAGLGWQAAGLGAALTGSQSLTDTAVRGQQATEAVAQRLNLSGSDSDLALRFAGMTAGAAPSVAVAMLGGVGAGAVGGLLAETRSGLALGRFLAGAAQATKPKEALAAFTSLAGSAAASGAQSGGAMYAQLYNDLTQQGINATEARRRALTGAALSAAGTTALTMGFGATGVESLFKTGAKQAFRTRTAALLKTALKEGAQEFPEEAIDQLWQGILDKTLANPQKPFSEIVAESIQAGLVGFVLGGAMGAATGAAAPLAGSPRTNPETVAAAEAQIAAWQGQPAAAGTVPDPQLVAAQQQRARAALQIAQGGFGSLSTAELESTGWTRQDGKVVPLKGYTGPAVLEFADPARTQPILRQNYLDALAADLPAVRQVIGMSEAEARAHYFARPKTTAAAAPPSSGASPQAGASPAASGAGLVDDAEAGGGTPRVPPPAASPAEAAATSYWRKLSKQERQQTGHIVDWLAEKGVDESTARAFAEDHIRRHSTSDDYRLQASEIHSAIKAGGKDALTTLKTRQEQSYGPRPANPGDLPAPAAAAAPPQTGALTWEQAMAEAAKTPLPERAPQAFAALRRSIDAWQTAFPGGVHYATDRVSEETGLSSSGGLMLTEDGTGLRVHLPTFAANFGGNADENAIEAVVTEEVIHVVASRELPAAEVRRLWRDLPEAIRQTVWTAYHAASINARKVGKQVPATVPDGTAYHMGHEFIRMLVQDSVFRGRITEAQDIDPGLKNFILQLLRRLAGHLRTLVKSSPTAIRQRITDYEAIVRQALREMLAANRATAPTAEDNLDLSPSPLARPAAPAETRTIERPPEMAEPARPVTARAVADEAEELLAASTGPSLLKSLKGRSIYLPPAAERGAEWDWLHGIEDRAKGDRTRHPLMNWLRRWVFVNDPAQGLTLDEAAAALEAERAGEGQDEREAMAALPTLTGNTLGEAILADWQALESLREQTTQEAARASTAERQALAFSRDALTPQPGTLVVRAHGEPVTPDGPPGLRTGDIVKIKGHRMRVKLLYPDAESGDVESVQLLPVGAIAGTEYGPQTLDPAAVLFVEQIERASSPGNASRAEEEMNALFSAVRTFLNTVPQAERPALIEDNDRLTAEGVQRFLESQVMDSGLFDGAEAAAKNLVQTHPALASGTRIPKPKEITEDEWDEYLSQRKSDKERHGIWLSGPYWHVTNYTYSSDSSYVDYRNALGVEHQFRISNHEKPPGHETDRYFRLQFIGSDKGSFRAEARAWIAAKIKAAPDLNLSTVQDVTREWHQLRVDEADNAVEYAQRRLDISIGKIDRLAKDLADKESALARGIRIGNGKPITTDNQRQIAIDGIEEARRRLAEANIESSKEISDARKQLGAARLELAKAQQEQKNAQSTPLTGQAGESRLDMRGSGPSKTGRSILPQTTQEVNNQLASAPRTSQLSPQAAARTYRQLFKLQQSGVPLKPAQQRLMEQAERALGQHFLFDDIAAKLRRPAADLTLEAETALDTSPPATVQLALFAGPRRPRDITPPPSVWEDLGVADDPTLQEEALEAAWIPFITASQANSEPLEDALARWRTELADPEGGTVAYGLQEARRNRRGPTDWLSYDVTRTNQNPDDPAPRVTQLSSASRLPAPPVKVEYLPGRATLPDADPAEVWNSLAAALDRRAGERPTGGQSGLEAEAQSLRQWAQETGRLLDPDALFRFFDETANGGHRVGGGQEHDVVYDPASRRMLKVTRPGQYGAKGLSAWLRNARLSRERFGDDLHLLGVVEDVPGTVQLVVSQPFIAGRAATRAEIDRVLHAAGYRRVSELTYFHPDRNEAVSDTQEANFVTSREDGRTHPVDVAFFTPDAATAETWENVINAGIYPPPSLASARRTVTDPRLVAAFGADHEADDYGMPVPPHTLPDGHPLLQSTAEKTHADIPPDHPLVLEGLLPAGRIPRKQLRRAIITHFIKAGTPLPPGQQPKAILLAGGTGAGKSTILAMLQNRGDLDASGAVHVNADDFRPFIPEYNALREAGDGRASSITHAEVAPMVGQIMDALTSPARTTFYDIIVDGVMGSPGSLKRIPQLQAQGFAVRLVGVTIDAHDALVRSSLRGRETGRWVPSDIAFDNHRGFNANLPVLMAQADAVNLYDNTPPEAREVASKYGQNEAISIVNPALYATVLQRGKDERTPQVPPSGSPQAAAQNTRQEGDGQGTGGPQGPRSEGLEAGQRGRGLASSRRDVQPSLNLFDFLEPEQIKTKTGTPAPRPRPAPAVEQPGLFDVQINGGQTNENPRPASQRPARPQPPSAGPQPAEPSAGFGELFDQGGLAGRPRPLGGTGLTGSGGTGGDGSLGGDVAGNPPGDAAAAAEDGGGTGLSGSGGTAGNDAAAPPARVERPAPGTPGRNFEPPADLTRLSPAGNKAKIQANLAAIRLLKELEAGQRDATAEEKRTLAAYTGWGAFKEAFNEGYESNRDFYRKNPHYVTPYNEVAKRWQSWEQNWGELYDILKKELTEDEFRAASRSTLNAHYTAAPVIRAMWRMVERLGFTGGRALEPSAGAGHFLGLQPGTSADRTQWQTVELDDLSARLLAKLYPEAAVNERPGGNAGREVAGLGFERARIPNGSLDLIVSNVPFHESGPRKKGFPTLNLHNFFFAHALDKVKPGGLVAFITSASTMQNNQRQRDFIASKGDLVAAFRLPNNAFKDNAGTEVVTDILILRKPDGTPFKGAAWRSLVEVGRQTITLTQGKEQTLEELRREAAGNGTVLREYSRDGVKAIDVDAPIMVNEYFAAHPAHVLGQHSLQGSMYRGNEYTVTAPDGLDVSAALTALADTLPENVMGRQQAAGGGALAAYGDRPFSFVEREGRLYEVQDDGTMLEPDWATNDTMVRTFRSWWKVKEAARELIQAENTPGLSEARIEALRTTLNRLYDTHVTTHGAVSKRFGNRHTHLYTDPEYPLTAALENEKITTDPKTGKRTYSYGKAAILKQRVVTPIAPPTRAGSFDEALQTSLAWRGQLSAAYMADLLGTTTEEVYRQAQQHPDVFLDPTLQMLETREAYLTGNVRRKLEEAEAAAEDDPQYQKNVAALRAAQPERRSIAAVSPNLGARWIPAPVYDAFIREVLGGSDRVEYIPAGNLWRISGTHLYRNEDYHTDKMGAAELFDTLMSLQEPMIYWKDKEGKRHFDATATAAAKSAAAKMKRAFVEFVKTSTVEVDGTPVWQLAEDAYNETQNSYVTPQQKGDYLQFPGLSADVWRTAHRRAVIARFISERRGMMAHGVGSGKTFNQIILAQELRRLGLARKPVIVVQNSTLGQFAASYLQAYPAARVLVPTERDLQTQNRRKLVSRIATGDYDAVILSHSQFDLISNKPEAVRAYMGEKIDELKALILAEKGGDKAKVRDLEGMLKRLEDRLASMLDALGERQDSTIYFEDLGVDALIVDEAHNYKSVPIVTRMGRVKGVPSGTDSQRAIGMLLKARHVQGKTGGKNVFLATGTPVKNSMAEAYIMLEITAPDVLRDYGIHNFDDFATAYGQITSSTEISWSGSPKVESRFAKFQNGRELITMVRSVFDVAMGNDKLGLKVPKVKGGAPSLDIVPVTPTIERFNAWVRSVADRWAQATGDEKEEFTAVPIMTLQAGIVAALDPRLLAPAAPDHADSKVNTAVREMLRLYKEGAARKTTQLVFADLRRPFDMSYLTRFAGHPFPEFGAEAEGSTFDLYQDIKAKLIAGGVPEKEILLMDPSMSKAKRTAMFEKVSSGEIRIAIGSTETLGVGVNVQERLKALHHLMPPRDFTPAMHEQRNGRAIRQGNLHHDWNEEIEVRQWGTEGSMDSAVYGTLGRKQRFITQLLMGEVGSDTFDDPTDPIAVNLAEMAARTMGDPDFIRRIELEKELRDLRLESDAFTAEQSSRRSRLNSAEAQVRRLPEEIVQTRRTMDALRGLWTRTAPRPENVRETTDISDKPVYEFGGKTVDTAAKESGITGPLDVWLTEQSIIMERRGLKQSEPLALKVNGHEFAVRVETTMPGSRTPGTVRLPGADWGTGFTGADGLIRVLREMPRQVESTLAFTEGRLTTARLEADNLRALLERDTAFPRAAELATLESELEAVDARLAAKAAPKDGGAGTAPAPDATLPPARPVDPDLMTDTVLDILARAWVIKDRLFLPDNLDRRDYLAVNKALESAGGTWNKRAKAHVFSEDPRPFLGPVGSQIPDRDPATPPLAAAPRTFGFNPLDRALADGIAAGVDAARSSPPGQAVERFVEHSYRHTAPGQLVKKAVDFVKGQLVPLSVLPREARALLTEMQIKQSFAKEEAFDLVRALSGKARLSDLAYPPGFAEKPEMRRQLWAAMDTVNLSDAEAKARLDALPPALQKTAASFRKILLDAGRDAVRAGLMTSDTYERLKAGYLPHYYENDEQPGTLTGFLKRWALGLHDIKQQRTTAWHILDMESKDPGTNLPKAVTWDDRGKQWRFRSGEHLNAFYEGFLADQALEVLKAPTRGAVFTMLQPLDRMERLKVAAELQSMTRESMDKLETFSPVTRRIAREVLRQQAVRFRKERPLTLSEKEKAGLIMDPVYSIARYVAQMRHDIAVAELFNTIAANPDWTSNVAVEKHTAIPDHRRFGRLAGKWVKNDIAKQIVELVEAPDTAAKLYDTLLSWWKSGKTVWNPGTHVRNVLGNVMFAQFAGLSPWNPANVKWFRQSLSTLRGADPAAVREMYQHGVLGADFSTAELKTRLKALLPDPATVEDADPSPLLKIGKATARAWAALSGKVHGAYSLEDETFKAAAFLKARSLGMSPQEAAAHVRKWFPYYDHIGTSATLTGFKRTVMPFLSFYRESLRIFATAAKERPLALAAGVALPSLLTTLSAMLLGLDDDDLEEIKKDMRGKGKFFLTDTPLMSVLLPVKSASGQYQMWDLSNVIPFADHLARRMEDNSPSPWWQYLAKEALSGGPIIGTISSLSNNKDPFGNRNIWEDDMTDAEKRTAALKHVVRTWAPPLVPGGTGADTLAAAGTRTTNKTLEKRDVTQAWLRAVLGLDVRNANPNLYRLAEDFRQKMGLLRSETYDGGTTAISRARAKLFAQLAQDQPDLKEVGRTLTFLRQQGQPFESEADLRKLLFYRHPAMVIRGKEEQQRFEDSLKGVARERYREAVREFEAIERRAPAIVNRARALVMPTLR